jgi:hypothetical protein
MKRLSPVAAVVLGLCNWAFACPFCDGPTGRAVNAGIFDDDFAGNLAISAVPFLILGLVAAVVHFGDRKHAER